MPTSADPVVQHVPVAAEGAPPHRLTMREIGRWVVSDGLELNGRLPFTVVHLFRRPGPAIRAYLAGSRTELASPMKYLLLAIAVYALVYVKLGIVGDNVASLVASVNRSDLSEDLLATTLTAHIKVLLVCTVPVLTLLSAAFYRPAKLNLAEHLTFNAFAYAQLLVLFVVVVVPFRLAGVPYSVYSLVFTFVGFGYYVYAAASFFRVGRLSGIARGVLTYGLTSLIFGFTLGVFIAFQAVFGTAP